MGIYLFILFVFICIACPSVLSAIGWRELIVKQLLLLLTISVFTAPLQNPQKTAKREWVVIAASFSGQTELEMLIHFCFIINLSIAHSSGPSNRVHSSVCLCGRRFLDLLGFCIFHIFAILCFNIDFPVSGIKAKFCNKIWILLIKCLEILHFLFLTHFSILH